MIARTLLMLLLASLVPVLFSQSRGSTSPQFGSSASGGAAAASAQVKGATGAVMAVPEDFSRVKIAPGFLLDVEVFDEPDFSAQLRVGEDGNIILPFAGPVHVAGETDAQAQTEIQNALKNAQILKYPQVTLNVLQYAPEIVTVLGEVSSPGRLQILAPHNLLDVLSFAGGETEMAGNRIEVRHQQAGETVTATYHYARSSNGESISNVMIHGGDTVIVPRAGIVYVLGQVQRPGGYLMQEDGKLDLAQAVSMAGGTTLLASTGHVLVLRRHSDGTFVRFEISYKQMTAGKVAPPALQQQDIIYVPNSKIKTAFSDTQGILSAAATASVYRTLQ
jgi:polysaccharide export outer membrane protein